MRHVHFWLAGLLLAACSTELPHEAPFDEKAPLTKQARAQLSGVIRLENETDFSQISLQLNNSQRTYSVQTLSNGSVALSGIVPGSYTMTIGTRYFKEITETITVPLNGQIELGERTLEAKQAAVVGKAVTQDNNGKQSGNVKVKIQRVASVRNAGASGAAYTGFAESTTATNDGPIYNVISDSDGTYRLTGVSAGVYELTASEDGVGSIKVKKVVVTGEDGDVKVQEVILLPMFGFINIAGKNAANAVSTQTVVVNLLGTGNPSFVQLAFDPQFITALPTFAMSATAAVELPAGDGLKNIYVRFFDELGNPSSIGGDSVVLDTKPPANGSFSIAEGSLINASTVIAHLSYFAVDGETVRIGEGNSGAATLCSGTREAYTGSKAWPLQATTGTATITVQFFDAVGNASACLTKDITIDRDAPVPDNMYAPSVTSSNVVMISFGATSGATRLKISENPGFTDTDWVPFVSTKTFLLSAGNGTKTIHAIVADDAGNTTTLTPITISLDTTPPVSPYLTVLNPVTTSSVAQLSLGAGLVTEMMISEDPAFAGASWQIYVALTNFSLSPGDGLKTVYAKFRKSNLVETDVVSATVTVDTTPPTLPSVRVNNGASVVDASVVTLNLSAVDSLSGLFSYKVNTTNDFSGVQPKTFQSTDVFSLVGGDGAKTVWVMFGDRAGNFSAPVSGTVILDTIAPNVNSAGLIQLDGTPVANGDTIRNGRLILSSTVTDATTLEMQVTTNGSLANLAWEPYNPNKVIDLTAASSNVVARVRDGAGHVSELLTGLTVNLDNTAPVLSLTLTSASPTNNLAVDVGLSANEAGTFAQVSADPAFSNSAWFAIQNTTVTLPAGDGVRTVYARIRDVAGNISDLKTVFVTIDRTPPQNVSFLITSGVVLNGLQYTPTRTLGLSYAGVDIANVRVAEGSCSGSYTALASNNTFNITSPGDGVKTIAVQFQDAVGNETVECLTKSVTLDTAAPQLGSFAINNGDAYTTSRTVTVGISVTGATEMQVSENSSFSGSSWQPVTDSVIATLSVGEGAKTLYARFRDEAGNLLSGVGDSILLDPTAPQSALITINTPTDGYTKSTTIPLVLSAAGATYMMVSESSAFTDATWQAYAPALNFVLANVQGNHTVYAQFKDDAGNVSTVVSARTLLDTVAPVGVRVETEDGVYATTATVNLVLIATGADSMKVTDSTNDITLTQAQPYSSLAAYSVGGGDGPKTVNVQFFDNAGNASPIYPITFTLDRIAPAQPILELNAGLPYLTSRFVAVKAFLDGTATEYQVSETPDFGGAAWLKTFDVFTLDFGFTFQTVGEGLKPLYVRGRDLAGNVSAYAQASVTLDTFVPVIASFSKALQPLEYATSVTVDVHFDQTGADYFRLSTDGTFDTEAWVATGGIGAINTSVTVSADNGVKRVSLQLKDLAGNVSSTKEISFVLDTVAPVAAAPTFASGTYARSNNVSLSLSAIGADFYQIGIDAPPAGTKQNIVANLNLSLPAPDGLKTVYLKFYDAAGNYSSTVSASVIVDTAPPTVGAPAVSINAGAAFSTSAIVTLALDVTGATEMRVSNQPGYSDTGWETVSASTTWLLQPGDGMRTVFVTFRDAAGNLSGPHQASINVDGTAPDVRAFVLNMGQDYASAVTVLTFADVNQATEARYSTDSSFTTGAGWGAFSPNGSFVLGVTNGTQTVYAQFRDAAGNVSAVFSDSIALDTTPPISGSVSIAAGAAYTKEPSGQVLLDLSAADALSGVFNMRISNDGVFDSEPVEPYNAQKPFSLNTSGGDGTKYIWVLFGDRAGNYAAAVSDAIILDRTKPFPASVVVANGDAYATSNAVTVTLAATDANGVTEYQLADNSSFGGGTWQAITTSTSFLLPSVQGPVTVFAKYKDAAGNESDPVSDGIIVDTQAPQFDNIQTPPVTNVQTVNLQIFAPPAPNATLMRFSEDSNFTGATWIPFAPSATYTVSAVDGSKTIYAELEDDAGHTSVSRSVTFTLDQSAPDAPLVSVKQGNYVNSVNIDVQTTADGATQILISQVAPMTDATWQPFNSVKPFALTGFDGAKTVYVKVRDSAGNTSAAGTAVVQLDRVAPSITTFEAHNDSGSNIAVTNSLRYYLYLDATDASSLSVQFSPSSNFSGSNSEVLSPPLTRQWDVQPPTNPLGEDRTAYVRVADAAGNFVVAGPVTVHVDNIGPTGASVSLGAAAVSSPTVTATLFANNADFVQLSQDISFLAATTLTMRASTPFTFTTGDGQKTLYVRFIDQLGNYSAVVADNTILDTLPPKNPSFTITESDPTNQSTLHLTLSATEADDMAIGEGVCSNLWIPYAQTMAYSLADTTPGSRTITVRFRDTVHNVTTPCLTKTFVFDNVAPVLLASPFLINSGAPATNSSVVQLSFNVTAATQLEVSEQAGFVDTSWVPYTALRSFTLSPGNGNKTVFARFRDAAGNEVGPVSASISLDTIAPSNPFIAVSSSITNSTSVTLTLSAVDANQMKISNLPDFSDVNWVTYATSKVFTLTGVDGNKTIYAKFRRSTSGYESAIVSTSILLDRAGPVDPSVELASSITYVTSTAVNLRLSAVDTGSGLDTVEISESSIFFDRDLISNRSIATYTLRTTMETSHPIYVRYRDRAGNYSSAVSVTVIYDVTPPTGSVVVAGGLNRVNSQFVTVALNSVGAQRIQIYNDSAAPTELPYSSSLVWAIRPIQDVPTTVNVRFVDAAGNVSQPYSDDVTYDTSPPSVTSFALDMTVSTLAVTVSWTPSALPSVTGYNWYRHANGLRSLGGSVAAAVSSVTIPSPVVGEEYSVSAVYAGGLESALSTPAAETGFAVRTKGILLVDDDGGAQSVENNLAVVLTSAGFTYDTVTVPAGADGPSATVLNDYQAVVWSSGEGPTTPTLSPFDRESLSAYLTTGGNLVFFGSAALDDGDTATFLKRWMHTGRVESNLPAVERLYVAPGDLGGVSGFNFPVGPAMTGVDAIYGSALSNEFLNAGKPVGIRYPLAGTTAAYRAAWLAMPTAGSYQRKVFSFNLVDPVIPSSGTSLGLTQNDQVTFLALPFPFSFGGLTYTGAWVNSNGMISFQAPVSTPPYPIFTTTDTANYPGAVITADWLDLNVENGGSIYYTSSATEVVIVWNGVPITGPSIPYPAFSTSAIRLTSDNRFEMISNGTNDSTHTLPRFPIDWVHIGFEDENGLGFGTPENTNSMCCDRDSFAVEAYFYEGVIPESITLTRNLVQWIAAPDGVKKQSPRYFTVTSNVAGAKDMRVSTDGALDSEYWQTYAASLPITGFTSADGAKSVQVIFVDDAGNQTTIYADTKILDSDAPRISNVILSDASTSSNAYTKNRTVTLQVLGTATALDFMRVSESPTFVNAGFVPYVESSTVTLSEGEGAKRVYVWLRDANGNISAPAIGTIVVDSAAPSTHAEGAITVKEAPIHVNTSYAETIAGGAFNWSGGTPLNIRDKFFTIRDLPFPFPFYGTAISRIVFWRAGVVTLEVPDPSDKSKPLPDEGVPADVFAKSPSIAPLYQDFAYTKTSQDIYVDSGTDSGVAWYSVRWEAEDPRSQSPINTAVKLYADGRIVMFYGAGNYDIDPLIGLSRGDQNNSILSQYSGSSVLTSASTLTYTPNDSLDSSVKLYYRYVYTTGPGSWIDTGVQGTNVFDGLSFYPPLGAGVYEFYTVGIDSAGNVEAAPATADLSVLFDDEPPLPPTEISAEADDDAVFVQWTPSTSPDVVAYKVYYGSDANLNGDDAIEGVSPIEIPAEKSVRLTALEPGKTTYVALTAVDRVGNESSRPSGVSFLLPHSIRKTSTFGTTTSGGGVYSNPQLLDESLFITQSSSGAYVTDWLDVHNPYAITQLYSGHPSSVPGLFLYDDYVFNGVEQIAVDLYSSLMVGTPYATGPYMAAVTPAILTTTGYPLGTSIDVQLMSNGVTVFSKPGIGMGVVTERNLGLFLANNCFGPCSPDAKIYGLSFDDNGNPTDLGLLLTGTGMGDDLDLASDYLALSHEYGSMTSLKGGIEVFDMGTPTSPVAVTEITDLASVVTRWMGDRILSGSTSEFRLYDFGDVASPVVESVASLSGRPSGVAVDGAISYVTTNNGIDVFEMGELLPSGIKNLSASLTSSIKALATAGDYVFVAEATRLSVFSLVNAQALGSPQLVATYAPFTADCMAVSGKYLYTGSNNSLTIFDISNPANPLQVWSATGDNIYGSDFVILGSTLFLHQAAYDISNPRAPQRIYEYYDENIYTVRAYGDLLYAVSNGAVRVYRPGTKGLSLIGVSAPITSVVDIAIDNGTLYAFQQVPHMCCAFGNDWSQLSVFNVEAPGAPVLEAQFSLPGGPSGGSYGQPVMAAERGFLYMTLSENFEFSGSTQFLVQADMRDRIHPVISMTYLADSARSESLTPPIAVTSKNFVVLGGTQSLSALRISANVPVLESQTTAIGAAEHTLIGDRYIYVSQGSTIRQIERRAPALALSLVGSGQVAITKRGSSLQLYDPPGVPAAALTADGTGRLVLDGTHYATFQDVCTALNATGRLTCSLSDPLSALVPSDKLIDAFGIRVRSGTTTSLRAPRVRKQATLPNGIPVANLAFDRHRLFAAGAVPGISGNPSKGLYEINPKDMSYRFHDFAGTNVNSLILRDSTALLGVRGAVYNYNWTTKTLGAGVSVGPNFDVTMIARGHDDLYYVSDNTPGNYRVKHTTGALQGGLQAPGAYDYPAPATINGIAYLAHGWIAVLNESGLDFVQDTFGSFQFKKRYPVFGSFVKAVNGKLLVGSGSKLTIMDASTLPPTNLVQRDLEFTGTVNDADVLGDMLVVGTSNGPVIYRLK